MNGSNKVKNDYVSPKCEVHVVMLENTILNASNEPVEEKTFPW